MYVIQELSRIGINPNDSIFYDDQVENVNTAMRHGINGIVVKNAMQIRNYIRIMNNAISA
jgi:FMN phosphatase YigB (HAD superfamily)